MTEAVSYNHSNSLTHSKPVIHELAILCEGLLGVSRKFGQDCSKGCKIKFVA